MQSMGMERTVSYSEIVKSNGGSEFIEEQQNQSHSEI